MQDLHFDKIFSKITNVPNPKFIAQYADLFVESRILERIIPRELNTADDLEFFNPYLIRDSVTESLVPDGASPYQGSDLNGVNRVSSLVFYSFLQIFVLIVGCLWPRVRSPW